MTNYEQTTSTGPGISEAAGLNQLEVDTDITIHGLDPNKDAYAALNDVKGSLAHDGVASVEVRAIPGEEGVGAQIILKNSDGRPVGLAYTESTYRNFEAAAEDVSVALAADYSNVTVEGLPPAASELIQDIGMELRNQGITAVAGETSVRDTGPGSENPELEYEAVLAFAQGEVTLVFGGLGMDREDAFLNATTQAYEELTGGSPNN